MGGLPGSQERDRHGKGPVCVLGRLVLAVLVYRTLQEVPWSKLRGKWAVCRWQGQEATRTGRGRCSRDAVQVYPHLEGAWQRDCAC